MDHWKVITTTPANLESDLNNSIPTDYRVFSVINDGTGNILIVTFNAGY